MAILDDLTPEYRTFDDILQGLGQLEGIFYEARDRRAIFATAYISITAELKRRVERGAFLDNPWVARYAVSFANLYRQALLSFERGDLDAVPKAWTISFDASLHNRALALQDLVLGINAHINHDLPLSLLEVSVDADREARHRDHTSVNDALNAATDPIKSRLETMYAPGLDLLDRAFDKLIDEVASFSFAKAREDSWVAGISLVNARDEQERAAIRESINGRAAVLANLILAPTALDPRVLPILRHVEELSPWWRYVTLPDLDRGAPAPVADEPLAVNSLDELIQRLEAIIQRYDSRRSKIAVYPSMYLLFTHRVKDAVARGDVFEDPAWMTSLDLHFATQYLRALDSFEAGRFDEMPRCWAAAFQATSAGQTLVLQDLILAVNARLNHDLAIALLRAGLEESRIESRRRDLEKMHGIFQQEMGPVQNLLAQKYSRLMAFGNLIAGRLESIVADFNYTRARDGAWDNAVALTRAPSEQARQEMAGQMDTRAAELAQKILLRGLPGGDWLIQALRHVENGFTGNWSEWLR